MVKEENQHYEDKRNREGTQETQESLPWEGGYEMLQ